jgi:hypothetical protein
MKDISNGDKSCTNCLYWNVEGKSPSETCKADPNWCAGEEFFKDRVGFLYRHWVPALPGQSDFREGIFTTESPMTATAYAAEKPHTLTREKMEEMIKTLIDKYYSDTEDAVMKILAKGGSPMIVHRPGDPPYVVDQNAMYFNPLKPLEHLDFKDPFEGVTKPIEDALRKYLPPSAAGNLSDEPICAEELPGGCNGFCDTCQDTVCQDDEIPDNPVLYADPEKQAEFDDAWDNDNYTVPDDRPIKEDMVDQPSHYANADIPSGIECWDWYELALTEEEFRGHMKGNALKYLFRAGRKDPAKTVEDLEKIRAYVKRWITFEKGDRTVWMRGKKNRGL